VTLLEALVVVALTVLVGGIAFPAIDHLNRGLAFESARATLVADLKATRAAAMRAGRPAALEIAGDGSGYAWAGGAVRLDGGIRLGADHRVAFAPDGSAEPAVMTLSRAAERRTVVLDAMGLPR
jgi:Tfp pilus assembly protein FimT